MLSQLLAFVLGSQLESLHLIPTPHSTEQKTGTFPLSFHADLVVARSSDIEDSFAAEQLLSESPDSFGWTNSRKRSRYSVLVGRIGRDSSVTRALQRLKIKPDKNLSPESYVLSIRPNQIVCAGNSAAGTFYAVQTLKQLVRTNQKSKSIPCLDIIDYPSLQIRGWQDDVSRGLFRH